MTPKAATGFGVAAILLCGVNLLVYARAHWPVHPAPAPAKAALTAADGGPVSAAYPPHRLVRLSTAKSAAGTVRVKGVAGVVDVEQVGDQVLVVTGDAGAEARLEVLAVQGGTVDEQVVAFRVDGGAPAPAPGPVPDPADPLAQVVAAHLAGEPAAWLKVANALEAGTLKPDPAKGQSTPADAVGSAIAEARAAESKALADALRNGDVAANLRRAAAVEASLIKGTK